MGQLLLQCRRYVLDDRVIELVNRAIVLNRYHKQKFNSIPNEYYDDDPTVIDPAAIFRTYF